MCIFSLMWRELYKRILKYFYKEGDNQEESSSGYAEQSWSEESEYSSD